LPEVEDLPLVALQDPIFHRSAGADPGRDGCRVPLPWTTTGPSFGFNTQGFTPWLPQPGDWGSQSVEAQQDDPGSMLSLYCELLARRPRDGEFRWHDLTGDDVIAFHRGPGFVCVVNFGAEPLQLPAGTTVLLASSNLASSNLASSALAGDHLPTDSAVWLRPSVGERS
jgi:alpha-glucosidase